MAVYPFPLMTENFHHGAHALTGLMFAALVMLWTPRGKDPHTFWGCNCSFWGL